jgi:hypothetical protein
MISNHHIWQNWANALYRWGLEDIAATLLEASGPLSLLGAQALYMGQPLLRSIFPDDQLNALANLLEDNHQTQAFATFLREMNST